MKQPENKADCKICKHASKPEDFMVFCNILKTMRAACVRICQHFEKKRV